MYILWLFCWVAAYTLYTIYNIIVYGFVVYLVYLYFILAYKINYSLLAEGGSQPIPDLRQVVDYNASNRLARHK